MSRRPFETDPGALERLRRHARALERCVHPNLVRVMDLDCHGGRPFVVMEDVYGLSLKQYALERRPGPREAAGLVVELARAVSYLQDRDIDPPDVDPASVVIDETGRRG